MALNPLSSARSKPAPADHPVLHHAKIWQHVNNMAPDDMAAQADQIEYGLPVMAALASKSNVTRKDVIKAAADAAGSGKIPPSQAVELISAMPAKPEDLLPWIKHVYLTNLTALVHMKASQMAQQAAPGMGAAPGASGPQSAPAPGPGAPAMPQGAPQA